MADERLAQARALIKAKQYQQARRTLTGLDHPTARVWLAKLDEIAPEVEEDDPFADIAPVKPKRRFNWRAAALLILALIVLVVGVLWYASVQLQGADARLRQYSDSISTQFTLTRTAIYSK